MKQINQIDPIFPCVLFINKKLNLNLNFNHNLFLRMNHLI